MAVYSYRLANGKTRWFYIIDLPPGTDGRRRQQKRAGFPSQRAAEVAEVAAKDAFAGADLNADGTVAAELAGWLAERELDVEPTTLSNYRDIVRCYIVPRTSALTSSIRWTSGSSTRCTRRCCAPVGGTAVRYRPLQSGSCTGY